MQTSGKAIVTSVLLASLALLCADFAHAQRRPYQGMEGQAPDRLFLSFSIGDGTYINYRCDYQGGCRSVIVAPLDFEVLFGIKLLKNFYLDLGVNWSVDYNDWYYDEVTYLVGLRPGVRIVLPMLFHRFLYFRGAVPIQYTLDDENLVVVGLLLGAGLEWRWQNVGLFVEVNIQPYFVDVYPGYYVIPAQARLGVAVHF